MNKCWCRPGWESSVSRPALQCDKPVLSHNRCKCGTDTVIQKGESYFDAHAHNTYLDSLQIHGDDVTCYHLCRYNSETGVTIAHTSEWKDNLYWKQIGFYTKELRICSHNLRHTHMRERLDEFASSYHYYSFLDDTETWKVPSRGGTERVLPRSLGHVIEFGAGGYTQTRNLLEHIDIHMDSITLVDPLLWPYGKLDGCTYQGGVFKINSTSKSYPTTLYNTSVEKWGERHFGESVLLQTPIDYLPANVTITQQYDTVIVMNTLVYSNNAFKFLETVYRSLKPGGLLLFHDRYFEDIGMAASRCKMLDFTHICLGVKKPLIEHFLSFFTTTPFFNTEQNERQKFRSREWCPGHDQELGYFVAVRKPIKVTS